MSYTIEEERGTFVSGKQHSHNGYYAGDFSTVPFHAPERELTFHVDVRSR